MSEENKYYMPDISEFHIGFEYEFRDPYIGDTSEWEQAVIKDGAQIDDIHRKDRDGSFNYELRCKLLDHSDILAAWWTSDSKLNNYEFNTYDFGLHEMKVWWHTKKDPTVEISNDLDNVVFSGTIKNASELNRIMKQVGII